MALQPRVILTTFLKYRAKLANSSLNSHLRFIKEVGYPTIFSASLITLPQWAFEGRKTQFSGVILVTVVSIRIKGEDMVARRRYLIRAYDMIHAGFL